MLKKNLKNRLFRNNKNILITVNLKTCLKNVTQELNEKNYT